MWKYRKELYQNVRQDAKHIVQRIFNEPNRHFEPHFHDGNDIGHRDMTERWIAHRAEGLSLEGNVGDFNTRNGALHHISHMVMDVADTNNAFTLQELEQLVSPNKILLLLARVTYSNCAHSLEPSCKTHCIELLNAKLQHAPLKEIDDFLLFMETIRCCG